MLRVLLPTMAVLAVLAIGMTVCVSEAPRAAAAATRYEIDTSHSSILFRLDHLGVSASYGRFNQFTGSFTFDAKDPAACAVEVTVDANSVDTAHEGRDEHLRKPDFFNAAQHKTITFKSTRVQGTTSPKHFDVVGNLTLRGVTKEVTVRMKLIGEKDLGTRFGYRAGFEGTLRFKRSEYGMGWGIDKGSLGDEVTLILAFEGVKK
ncbi:MAG: YceI family protein [Planctomycetota bacterium]|nr:YceI family protein [Planctomycetota bacterium]